MINELSLQETGFYRVNYDRRNWEMIIEQLKRDHTKIHVINRAQGLYSVMSRRTRLRDPTSWPLPDMGMSSR